MKPLFGAILALLGYYYFAPWYVNGAPNSHSSVLIRVRVDQSGRGDFTKIQDAIDSVPSGNSNATLILVGPGIYNEKVVVPVDKPFITLSGTKAYSTTITWNEPWTNVQAPTVSIMASDFVGRFLTIQNTFGPGAQAVALRVSGDRAAFYACRFISFQDTVLDDAGRHYYKNCYIEGAVDVICGDGKAFFEKCHLHSVSENGGAITAQRRVTVADDTGYSFVGCKVTGIGKLILGRPWGNYSRVVFANAYMTNAVLPRGWDDWADPNNQRTAFYGEYGSYGPGSDASGRVGWSHQLSQPEALPFLSTAWIDGQDWLASNHP